MRSKDLSLCTIQEIKKELKKQGVIDVRRISIKKEDKTIELNTYVMTFNALKNSMKIEVGYTIEMIKQLVPNSCYKCQKYGHHEDACRGREVCGK